MSVRKGRSWIRIVGFALLVSASPLVAQQDDQEMERVEETVVVTASRTEQTLIEAPVAMTVISSEQIQQSPVDDAGDILRNVPGLNVSQMSARDIQITGRGATSSLATSQLVLVDNRSIYLDFFGFVIWEYMPVNPREIKQIEVVRGPGSAVWGANALSGVVNVITKPPKEIQGTSVTLGGGDFETAFASLTTAGVSDRLGYKLSASYYEQAPYDRPTGIIPGTTTPYPPFENQGTEQPKVDLRFDYDTLNNSSWRFSGGYAGTDGIIHTGIGPFDIDTGSNLSYFQTGWAKGSMRAGLFVNLLDGDATNLLTVGPDGLPLLLGFQSETYNLDLSDTAIVGDSHIVTYGANARSNSFDLTIAPQGDSRDEYGVFLQDEILIGDHVRWLIGARWDDIDPIGSVVSPRTSLMISPTPNQSIRLSYNEAFRAPSLINNYLEIVIVNLVPLPTGPYVFPSAALGNPELTEEKLEAIELGYIGTFGNTTWSISLYENETTDSTDFFTAAYYTSQFPPPNFPLPPFVLDIPPQFGGLANTLPAVFSYRNVGKIVDTGVEFGVNRRGGDGWSWFLNYSWQDKPDVTGIPASQVNIPPENRANAGLAYDGGRFFANGNVNYVDEAFWTDVLDSRFHGPTDEYTMVNLAVGFRFGGDGDHTFKVDAQNAFDDEVQQHVFGDIIGRKVTGKFSLNF